MGENSALAPIRQRHHVVTAHYLLAQREGDLPGVGGAVIAQKAAAAEAPCRWQRACR